MLSSGQRLVIETIGRGRVLCRIRSNPNDTVAQDPGTGWQAPEIGRAEGLGWQGCGCLKFTNAGKKRSSGANHNNLFVFWHEWWQTFAGGLNASRSLRFVQGERSSRAQGEGQGSIAESGSCTENDVCNPLAKEPGVNFLFGLCKMARGTRPGLVAMLGRLTWAEKRKLTQERDIVGQAGQLGTAEDSDERFCGPPSRGSKWTLGSVSRRDHRLSSGMAPAASRRRPSGVNSASRIQAARSA